MQYIARLLLDPTQLDFTSLHAGDVGALLRSLVSARRVLEAKLPATPALLIT